MSDVLLERLLELSAFDGDSTAALRALYAHFAHDYPGCSLALLFVREDRPGRCRLAGLIGPDGTEHLPNSDPFDLQNSRPRFGDALTRRLLATGAPCALTLTPAERGLPLATALFSPAAVLGLPVVNAGQISHWLVLGSTHHERFERLDPAHALLHANLAANLVIRQLALRTLEAETERQRAAIEGLADVQRLLLPDSPPIRGLDYAVHWQPAETAAGDYYDLMVLTEFADPPLATPDLDMWGAMLGDVSGHGAAAAMEGVQFDAILRTYQGNEPPLGPAGAITYANRYFFSRRQRRHFLTVFAVLLRPDTRELSYVCAGHPPAALLRAGQVSWLGAGDDADIPLGILREHRWDNMRCTLEPGDVLVLYTDGIVEARDTEGDMFGRNRLEEALLAADADAAESVKTRIVAAVQAFQGAAAGADDQTLIVLRLPAQ